jgi:hypothetical protein
MSAPAIKPGGIKHDRGAAALLATLGILAPLLPMLYVAAIGPLVSLNNRGYFGSDTQEALIFVYWPLEWTAQHCEPVGTALEWYVSLWTPPIEPPPPPKPESWR